ncbi:30S ribosome-binding factor RbfA [Nakamurella sp. GG22]
MADSARARRLAKRIVAIVATELQHQVKDPRLAMVTITAATVTPDLREATVFYTVYGDDDEIQGTAMALASATGVLRSAVGAQTGIKFTPTLVFKLDTVPENAYRINELLEAARSADAQVAERAAGASYAGEPDPYRVPRAAEADDEDTTGADDRYPEDLDADASNGDPVDGSPQVVHDGFAGTTEPASRRVR